MEGGKCVRLELYLSTLNFRSWSQSRAAPEFEAVQVAGEPERACRAQREVAGISVDAQTWKEMVEAGRKVGVSLPA